MYWIKNERGWVSVFSVLMTVACLVVMGIAIDVNNLIRVRTQLQVVSDNTAHAALYLRQSNDASAAKARAVAIANVQMPTSRYGFVLETEDIQFGSWDADAEIFTIDSTSKSGVLVTTERFQADGNGVATYLLRLVGYDQVDVQSQAVFTTYRPTCLREGFVADGTVDMQSNNTYSNGFCVHSNTHAEFNIDNTFEPGTIIAMPDTADIGLPNSGYDKNEGLPEALRDGYYNLRVLNEVDDMIADLLVGGPNYTPDYITSTIPITLPSQKVSVSDFTAGRIHTYTCSGGQKLTINDDSSNGNSGNSTAAATWETLEDVVLVTNCQIKFGQNLVIQNSVIATTNTGDKSLNAPSELQLGEDDNCAEGGGTVLLTMGGVDFSSKLDIFGSRIIALGDVAFAANADGIQGASIIAGGEIDGTSNTAMAFCGTGMDSTFEVEYFRLGA